MVQAKALIEYAISQPYSVEYKRVREINNNTLKRKIYSTLIFTFLGGIRNSAMVRKALMKRLGNQAGMNVEAQMNPLDRAA